MGMIAFAAFRCIALLRSMPSGTVDGITPMLRNGTGSPFADLLIQLLYFMDQSDGITPNVYLYLR